MNHHSARTVANSAAFVGDRFTSGASVLDVGCGPGSITIEIAGLVEPGTVLGIDPATDVLETANDAARAAGIANIEFRSGSVSDLDQLDHEFDVVFAHQVLQHLTDPVAALRHMGAVVAPGGVVAVRDADYGAMAWAPAHPMLDRWMQLYHEVTSHNGAEADAGRHLLGWAQAAGLSDISVTTSTWTYADPAARAWWGNGWAARAVDSGFATQAIEYGLSDERELESISKTWQWWVQQPDGYFLIPHTELVASP